MFDRLYEVRIRHASLNSPNNELVFKGDSSKPSLPLRFRYFQASNTISFNGSASIKGLTKEHLEALNAYTSKRIEDNWNDRNMFELWLGAKDSFTGKTTIPMTKVLGGFLSSVSVESPPSHTVNFGIVCADAFSPNSLDQERYLSEAGVDSKEMLLWDWVKTMVGEKHILPFSAGGEISVMTKAGERNPLVPLKVADMSARDFISTCVDYGLVAFADKNDAIFVEDPAYATELVSRGYAGWKIDKNHGMIGIPSIINRMAKVNVVIDPRIRVGDIITLKSDYISEGNGVYRIFGITTEGDFHGNSWSSSLDCTRVEGY